MQETGPQSLGHQAMELRADSAITGNRERTGASQKALVLKKPHLPNLPAKPACQCRRRKRHGFDPWVGKIPWRRACQLIPTFFPGESHGQKEPSGLQSTRSQESVSIEHLHVYICIHIYIHIYVYKRIGGMRITWSQSNLDHSCIKITKT